MTITERALEIIQDGNIVGLGTGRAAMAFIEALGKRLQTGLRIRGVPTSRASADLAAQSGIPLISLEEDVIIDVTVDGADEVDPHLDLIKGYGGALVREKIVAAASRRLVILVGIEKLVPVLGSRGILPVEVVPFATGYCRRRLLALGFRPTVRTADGRPYVTDNGNHILNCGIPIIPKPAALDTEILTIPGVVGTGLFIGMAQTVLIQDGERVETRQRQP